MHKILIHDSDNDGVVSHEEIEQTFRRRLGLPADGKLTANELKQLMPKIGVVMDSDINGDGKIIHREMLQSPRLELPNHRDKQANLAQSLLKLDPDKNGYLTIEELTKMAEETFRYYDTDGDNTLFDRELEAIRQRSRQSNRRPLAPCGFPSPSPEEQVVLLGVDQGMATAGVSVTAMTKETTSGTIFIETGKAPLYIVASSMKPMIWQFNGDTNRVSRVFILSRYMKGAPGTGVAGLPKEKISFVSPFACFIPSVHNSQIGTARARTATEESIERPVDQSLLVQKLGRISLPSGALPPPVANTGNRQSRREIVDFDPAEVVAPGLVYRVKDLQ